MMWHVNLTGCRKGLSVPGVSEWSPNPSSSDCATLGGHLQSLPQFLHLQRMTHNNAGLRDVL